MAKKKDDELYAPAMPYTASDAWKKYKANESKKPGEFSYDDSAMKKYAAQLADRKFTFDLNGNALYNQYKDYFKNQGQMAMRDTVGQASQLTGGYGNSYAVSAGQQAYQQSLQKLGEMVPQIYQMALDQYQTEGDELRSLYSMAADERDFAYGRHRDAVADHYNQSSQLYSMYRDAYGAEYDAHRDAVADDQWQQQFQYQQGRDAVADRQWQQQFDYQKGRDDISDSQWQQQFDYQQQRDKSDEQLQRDKMKQDYEQWLQEFNAQDEQFWAELNKRYASSSGGSSGKSGGSSSSGSSSGGSGAGAADLDNVERATYSEMSPAAKRYSDILRTESDGKNPQYHNADGTITDEWADMVEQAYQNGEISAAELKGLLYIYMNTGIY